jgi:hypothetical protein
LKISNKKRAGRVAQEPSRCETLSSSPSITKKKKKPVCFSVILKFLFFLLILPKTCILTTRFGMLKRKYPELILFLEESKKLSNCAWLFNQEKN